MPTSSELSLANENWSLTPRINRTLNWLTEAETGWNGDIKALWEVRRFATPFTVRVLRGVIFTRNLASSEVRNTRFESAPSGSSFTMFRSFSLSCAKRNQALLRTRGPEKAPRGVQLLKWMPLTFCKVGTKSTKE